MAASTAAAAGCGRSSRRTDSSASTPAAAARAAAAAPGMSARGPQCRGRPASSRENTSLKLRVQNSKAVCLGFLTACTSAISWKDLAWPSQRTAYPLHIKAPSITHA